MSYNVIFMGWNRTVPGREAMSAEHFQEVLQYLGGLHLEGVGVVRGATGELFMEWRARWTSLILSLRQFSADRRRRVGT